MTIAVSTSVQVKRDASKSYALFLGCAIPSSQIFVERAFRLLAEKLGIRVIDLEGATCCPDPEISKIVSYEAWIRIAARNLSLAEKIRSDICVICNGCYKTLLEANMELKSSPELLREVNSSLTQIERQYSLGVEVSHVIEVLHDDFSIDDLQRRIAKSLAGLRVAIHPGCRLYRDPEKELPEKLSRLVKATGATVVNYEALRLCCGVPAMYADPQFALEHKAKAKIEGILSVRPDCVVLVCPACHDMIEKAELSFVKEEDFMPVINLTELVALGLGFKPEEIGMDVHRIPTNKVIEKIGL